MKLHQQRALGSYNTFTAYGENYVQINEVRYEHSLLVMPEGPILPWPVASFAQLGTEHFLQIAKLAPEVVVFGSGARLRFLHPQITRVLAEHHIGFETMDVHAACRTYNILMSEERQVLCALLLETGEGP